MQRRQIRNVFRRNAEQPQQERPLAENVGQNNAAAPDQAQPQPQQQQQQQQQQQDEQPTENVNPSVFRLIATFVLTFFTSLIPDRQRLAA